MKFASLGSGSEGNALLVSTASGATKTTVMLDCGFAIRETARRMARLDMVPSDLAGIVVTHEHHDHVSGVFKLARRYHIPVWLTYGTYQAVQKDCHGVAIEICRDGEAISIGDLELTPYTVPHDAREPVQYVASNGSVRLGVLTDVGHATTHLIHALGGCHALMLECNHDVDMLSNSSYPFSLKQRISGAFGHLSNASSAQILEAVDKTHLKAVVAAHLSRQNNTPQLALAALHGVLRQGDVDTMVACQDQGFDWVDVLP